jgi:subtilase family serine protease
MGGPAASSLPVPVPAVSDYQFLSASTTPPTEAHCFAIGRRCFTATAMENSYNLLKLYAAGNEGQGVTIAIIDSFGNPNMASDLANFDTQMGLPHMCGEPGQACGAGIPTFQHMFWNGRTEVKAPPPGSHSPGLQDRNSWTIETSLDVEWAHAMARWPTSSTSPPIPRRRRGCRGSRR